jgi:alpha-tubulin suppressor-like RCC1 family protein
VADRDLYVTVVLLTLAFPACGSRTALDAFDHTPSRGGASSGSGGSSSTGGKSSSTGGSKGGGAGAPGTGGTPTSGGSPGSGGAGATAGGASGAGGEAGAEPRAVDLALGAFHSCAGFDDGSLRCWGTGGYIGSGNEAMIGDDETPDVVDDVAIGGIVRQIAASWYHTCALLASGNVRCFGNGIDGKLGYGNVEDIGDDELPSLAGDVNVGGKVTYVAAGPSHTCVSLQNGNVRCWGSNDHFQLGHAGSEPIGDNESPASAGFVDVGGFVVQLAAGFNHTCALLDTGAVRCWGTGILGYGNLEVIGDDESPASAGDIDVGGRVVQIAAGMFQICALLETGSVRCWGRPYMGALGYGNTQDIGDNETPASVGDVQVGGPVTQIAAGDFAICALTGSDVRCWGGGDNGELGYGNTEVIGDDETPASAGSVAVGGPVTRIDVGFLHVCALLADGRVRCWGRGSTGALGYGNIQDIGDDEAPSSAGDVKIR